MPSLEVQYQMENVTMKKLKQVMQLTLSVAIVIMNKR